jgi:hypothetical protein
MYRRLLQLSTISITKLHSTQSLPKSLKYFPSPPLQLLNQWTYYNKYFKSLVLCTMNFYVILTFFQTLIFSRLSQYFTPCEMDCRINCDFHLERCFFVYATIGNFGVCGIHYISLFSFNFFSRQFRNTNESSGSLCSFYVLCIDVNSVNKTFTAS